MSECAYHLSCPTVIADFHPFCRVEFVLANDVVEDLRHTLLRYVHNKVLDFSETIVRM